MAQVTAKVTGGTVREIEADTVGDARDELGAAGYTATVNGQPAADETGLEDYSFVVFSPAVKGARS